MPGDSGCQNGALCLRLTQHDSYRPQEKTASLGSLPRPHVYGTRISNPGGRDRLHTPGVATWKGHSYICNLCVAFPLGFVEQKGKEPPGSVYSVLPTARKEGPREGEAPRPQGLGRGDSAGGRAQCRVASRCLSADVQAAGWRQDRSSPGREQSPFRPD